MRSRMHVLALLMAILPTAIGSVTTAQAQTYPAKTIRLIVPFAPGGNTDIIARIVSPRMSEALGQQVVVDNRGGAGSIIGTEIAARAPADGYTLLMVSAAHVINPRDGEEAPLRFARGLHLHFARGRRADGVRRASGLARDDRTRVHRARPPPPRRAELFDGRSRHCRPPRRRAAVIGGEDQTGACALPKVQDQRWWICSPAMSSCNLRACPP